MLVLYGIKHKMEKETWAGAGECPVCGVARDRFLARRRTAFTLFYIPVVWFNTGRYLISCENCQTGAKLKKKEYNEARDKFVKSFENLEFPAYVAERYYNKKALGKTWSIVKVVLAWVWALLMGYAAVVNGLNAFLSAAHGELEIPSIIIAAAAVLLGIIPIIKTHKKLSGINKKLRIAKLYEGKIDAPAVADTAAKAEPAAEVTAPVVEEAAPVAEVTAE